MAVDPMSGGSDATTGGPSHDKPLLPYGKAFVVHFSAETDVRLERAVGRVEHLETGRRATFASVVELLERIVVMLGEERPPVVKPAGPAPRGAGGGRPRGTPGRGGSAPRA